MQSNAILNTLPNADRLKVAHSALRKATSKKEICLEDTNGYDGYAPEIFVDYFNEHTGDFKSDQKIQRTDVIEFIDEFYNGMNTGYSSERYDYEYGVSASDYFVENIESVLKDYLNNSK